MAKFSQLWDPSYSMRVVPGHGDNQIYDKPISGSVHQTLQLCVQHLGFPLCPLGSKVPALLLVAHVAHLIDSG